MPWKLGLSVGEQNHLLKFAKKVALLKQEIYGGSHLPDGIVEKTIKAYYEVSNKRKV